MICDQLFEGMNEEHGSRWTLVVSYEDLNPSSTVIGHAANMSTLV